MSDRPSASMPESLTPRGMPRPAAMTARLAVLAALALPAAGCASFGSLASLFDFGASAETKTASLEAASLPGAPVATDASAAAAANEAPVASPQVAAAPDGAATVMDEPTAALSGTSGSASIDKKAQTYEAFRQDVDAISGMGLKTPKEVRAAFSRLLKHQPAGLSDGWIAYGARVAAENKAFAKAVADEVADRGRDKVLARIEREPKYLMKLDGAYDAMDDVMTLVSKDTAKLDKLGERFIATAYAFQKNKQWGSVEPGTPRRMAEQGATLIPAAYGAPGAGAASATERVLKLAAYLAAGAGEGGSALTADKSLEQCLRWARLNLNQCMAAAYFPSEEAYCTGKHGINEVSACWSKLVPSQS